MNELSLFSHLLSISDSNLLCNLIFSGRHNGFGVYLSPDGEKYSGYWLSGRKHGTGRYSFANGDFYDGRRV